MPFNQIRYRWQLLRAGPIKLDGGGMFGVVPKVLWSRGLAADERNRVTVGHNCLLLRSEEDASQRIVIEVGSGDKFDAKLWDIYGLNDYSIVDALAAAHCRPDEIAHVIVSHLHFDHAGGLTRRVRQGESTDWADADYPAGVKQTFPAAQVHVQQREWDDALANRSVMTRTYLRDHLEPIRPQLKLQESRPYDPVAAGGLDDVMTEILPGIWVFLVPGHTWGQQAILFTDDRGRTVVFTPDVMATVHHVGAAYSMAYDVEPYTSMLTRQWFLKEAAAPRDWLLVLDHEPGHPLQRVTEDGKGWYRLVPE